MAGEVCLSGDVALVAGEQHEPWRRARVSIIVFLAPAIVFGMTVTAESHREISGHERSAPVDQACAYTLSFGLVGITSAGGSITVGVSTGAGCPWTSVSNASWLTVTAGATSSGS